MCNHRVEVSSSLWQKTRKFSVWLEFNQNKLENDLFVKARIVLQGFQRKARQVFQSVSFHVETPDRVKRRKCKKEMNNFSARKCSKRKIVVCIHLRRWEIVIAMRMKTKKHENLDNHAQKLYWYFSRGKFNQKFLVARATWSLCVFSTKMLSTSFFLFQKKSFEMNAKLCVCLS
jgi:hypothetical protein